MFDLGESNAAQFVAWPIKICEMNKQLPEHLPIDQVLREAFRHLFNRAEAANFGQATGAAMPIVPVAGQTLSQIIRGALQEGRSIVVYSPEFPAWHVALNLIAAVGSIQMDRMRSGNLEDEDWSKTTQAIHALRKTKIYFCNSSMAAFPKNFDQVYVIRPS